MNLADPELALRKVREFLAIVNQDWDEFRTADYGQATAELRGLLPLMRDIAERVQPRIVADMEERTEAEYDEDGNYVWPWVRVLAAAETLVGVIKNARVREQILGPSGPTLAAEGLHRWVWHAAVDLWAVGAFKPAVNAAAAAVEELTQDKLKRGDLSGAPLYTEAFKVGRVGEEPDGRRLRFPHLDELTEDGKRNQSWTSAHQGAMDFGRGCAEGIRNMNAHGTRELPAQEALEYLAALSVLARWVDTARVINGDPEPEPF